jgi:hypothetical protein
MSRLVGDETVLLDMSSGIYFGLDGVGQRIWESIAEGKTVGQTAASIAGEYDIEHARAETDVIEFVGELLERGLLLRS